MAAESVRIDELVGLSAEQQTAMAETLAAEHLLEILQPSR